MVSIRTIILFDTPDLLQREQPLSTSLLVGFVSSRSVPSMRLVLP
jgi:hypothetical protein